MISFLKQKIPKTYYSETSFATKNKFHILFYLHVFVKIKNFCIFLKDFYKFIRRGCSRKIQNKNLPCVIKSVEFCFLVSLKSHFFGRFMVSFSK